MLAISLSGIRSIVYISIMSLWHDLSILMVVSPMIKVNRLVNSIHNNIKSQAMSDQHNSFLSDVDCVTSEAKSCMSFLTHTF